MFRLSTITILTLIFSSPTSYAEDDFDLEFNFGIKRKSTISDFPMQEIGSDDLSDAAIGGALHTSVEGSGKPAYAEQNEKDDKRKASELEENDTFALSEDTLTSGIQESAHVPRIEAALPQETVSFNVNGIVGYNHDTVYTNNNNAFERP